jgi:hypothetical protein
LHGAVTSDRIQINLQELHAFVYMQPATLGRRC